MKLSTITINFAPLLKLFSKRERDKLKLKYYEFLSAWYHGNSKRNTNT